MLRIEGVLSIPRSLRRIFYWNLSITLGNISILGCTHITSIAIFHGRGASTTLKR